MKSIRLITILSLFLGTFSHAEVYKCQTDNGEIIYTDQPCDNKSKVKKIDNELEPLIFFPETVIEENQLSKIKPFKNYPNRTVLSYFNEIALKQEFSSADRVVKKWPGPIKIYVSGDKPSYMMNEVTQIIDEINKLINTKKLSLVDRENESNFHIYLGSAKEYLNIEPKSEKHLKNNWGFFHIYWHSDYRIYKGSMYVDMFRTRTNEERLHFLREELTQSLGLMNDSEKYENSIFYSKWSSTTEFTELDEVIIRLLYNKKIKPGMSNLDVKGILF